MFDNTSLNSYLQKKYFNLLPNGALLAILDNSYLNESFTVFGTNTSLKVLHYCLELFSRKLIENSIILAVTELMCSEQEHLNIAFI